MLDTENLKQQINNTIDAWAQGQETKPSTANELNHAEETNTMVGEEQKKQEQDAEPAPAAPEKPKDQRVVRTKSSGDRVYLLNDIKKSRQWVYDPQVLESLGFTMADVGEIEDSELLKYSMGPAILKPVEKPDAKPQA